MTKKILSLALVLMMMFSLAVPAFAASIPDEVYTAALEESAIDFKSSDVSTVLINAAKVSSATLSSSTSSTQTYDVTVTTGLIYTYTCSVTYNTSTGATSVSGGTVTITESIPLAILCEIYEFFLEFISAINDLLVF